MSKIKSFIQGTTFTDQINPDAAEDSRRMDEKTKELIKKHGHLSNDRKHIKIYVGRAELMQSNPEEGVSYRRLHSLYWSISKATALKKAKENLMKMQKGVDY